MFIVNFKENTPQQRFYNVGVIGDSKANKIQFTIQKQQEDIDLSSLYPFLKLQNKEHKYYDKIQLDKTSDDNFLYLVWEMERKSTHFRNLELQIAFTNSDENEDIVWQTMMFEIELGENISVDEKISKEYPSVLEQLEKEVHTFDERLESVESGLEELDESAVKKTDVVDNLESEATDKPLSANQGRLLNVKINNLIGSVYKPQGSITVDSLNALDTSLLENGYVYNMLDSGIITLGNIKVMEGDNVAWIIENNVGQWDKLSGLVDLSNYPTLDGNNTFTGTNTFNNGIKTPIKINYDALTMSEYKFTITNIGALRLYGPSNLQLDFSNNSLKTISPNGDLGTGDYHWRKGFINKITDTNGSYSSDNVFNVINASDIVNNTLTQEQYDLITNGKPTLIKGTYLGYKNMLITYWKEYSTSWRALAISEATVFSVLLDTSSKTLNTGGSDIALNSVSNITPAQISGRSIYYYLNNVYPYASNTTTTLQYKTINTIDLSADRTFTLATAPNNTYPEYKANITNSGASAINITLPSGTTIKTNDDNIVIASNVMTLPSGTTIELSIQNNNAIAFNWGA